MKEALVSLAILLSGCAAHTDVFEDGKKVASIYSDAANVDIRTAKGTTFHADTLNQAEPIKSYGGQIASILGALGTAIAAAAAGIAIAP